VNGNCNLKNIAGLQARCPAILNKEKQKQITGYTGNRGLTQMTAKNNCAYQP